MLTLPKKINKIIGIASKADMKKKQVRKQEILSSSSSDSESSSSSSCHEIIRKKIKK